VEECKPLMAGGTTALVTSGSEATAAAMPFEAVAISSLSRPYAPYDAAFPGGYVVPATKGGTVTVAGRGLHSSTFQLNLSIFYRIGGAGRDCVAHVNGVLGGVLGGRVFLCVRHGSS